MVLVLVIWGMVVLLVAVIVLLVAHAQSVKEDNPRRKKRDDSSNPSRAPRVAGANISFTPTGVGEDEEVKSPDNRVYVGNSSSVVEVHNFRNGTKEKARSSRSHRG